MSDLISRQEAINALGERPDVSDYWTDEYSIGQRDQYDADRFAIETVPTVEPKRGKWINDGKRCALYKCSACNDLCTVAGWANCIPEEQMYKGFKFCPNCGAKMERNEE